MMEWWWAYLALGVFVGFFGGLLGIGGGSALVPVLALIYSAKGFPQEHVVHLALGTGIATIIFTSASSVRSRHQHKAVNWSAGYVYTPALAWIAAASMAMAPVGPASPIARRRKR